MKPKELILKGKKLVKNSRRYFYVEPGCFNINIPSHSHVFNTIDAGKVYTDNKAVLKNVKGIPIIKLTGVPRFLTPTMWYGPDGKLHVVYNVEFIEMGKGRKIEIWGAPAKSTATILPSKPAHRDNWEAIVKLKEGLKGKHYKPPQLMRKMKEEVHKILLIHLNDSVDWGADHMNNIHSIIRENRGLHSRLSNSVSFPDIKTKSMLIARHQEKLLLTNVINELEFE